MSKKIITTLEQYNKKYRNRRYRLLKVAKKEVEDFDKKFKYTDHYLLKGRKWVLIDGTYYEIPRAPRYTWFRNLHSACQAGTCVLAAGIVATAVTLPFVLNNSSTSKVNENQWKEAIGSIIDATKERNVTALFKNEISENITSGSINFSLSYNEDATLKIVNATEYENTTKITKSKYLDEEHNINWYQKNVDGKIKSKKFVDEILEEDWVVNDEYISSTVGLNEIVEKFNEFKYEDNSYKGTIKEKQVIEEMGVEIEMEEYITAKFENNKLKSVCFVVDFDKDIEITISEGYSFTARMTMTDNAVINLIDYGTTSFEMPE